jgi:hypothetical protein
MIKSETAHAEDQSATLMGQFVEGFRFIIENRLIFALVVLGIAPLAFGRGYITMLPAYAVDILNKSPETVGGILSLAAIGSVTGGLFIASRGNIRLKGRLMLGASMMYGFMLMIFGFVKWLIVLIPIVIMIGGLTGFLSGFKQQPAYGNLPGKAARPCHEFYLLGHSLWFCSGYSWRDYFGLCGCYHGLFWMGMICLGIAAFISIYYLAVRAA